LDITVRRMRGGSRGKREISGYKYRVAPGTAITGNGDNDTAVRTTVGETPIELVRSQPLDDFPWCLGVSRHVG